MELRLAPVELAHLLQQHHVGVELFDRMAEDCRLTPSLMRDLEAEKKLAGAAKKSEDPAQGQELLNAIDEISKIFWETKS